MKELRLVRDQVPTGDVLSPGSGPIKEVVFLRRHPRNASLYGLGRMRFVIVDRILVTVYRPVGERVVPEPDGEHWREGLPELFVRGQFRAHERGWLASIRGTPPVGGLF